MFFWMGASLPQVLTERHGRSSIFVTAQLDAARDAKDAAIGVIGNPYDPPALLGAVKIAAAIGKGEPTLTMPGVRTFSLKRFEDRRRPSTLITP